MVGGLFTRITDHWSLITVVMMTGSYLQWGGMVTITKGMRVHFVGVGGIGMSGLAAMCLDRGCVVSGCDTALNAIIRGLQERGATIRRGHHPRHLEEGVDLVVYSSAVPGDAPELREARECGIRTMTRGELLAALAHDRHLVAIAGAHGKTTTSGMASQLLVQAGWDPAVVVGGVMLSLGTNARAGSGTYMVAETDESDGSFLHLAPRYAIVTNVDREHVNYYQTYDHLVGAFAQFIRQLEPGGTLIRCHDDAEVRRLPSCPTQISYGMTEGAEVTAEAIRLQGYGSRFLARARGRALGEFRLQVPGRHNVLNALAVIALGVALELPLTTMQDALGAFRGTRRRFQLFRSPSDIWLVEDYAHHPSEIRVTLDADPMSERHRLVVFQPHRFSRTQLLEREFARCFERADGVIVTDIYSAFEPPIPGVSGERLALAIRAGGHPWVRYVPKGDLRSFVSRVAQPGDTIFFLGAGDIGEVCHALATQLCAAA